MPRGIPGSGAAKGKAKAASKVAGASAPAAPAATSKAAPAAERESHTTDVDRMYGEALKTFARQVGVVPRDIENLTEDKLRQSCKLVLAAQYEDD